MNKPKQTFNAKLIQGGTAALLAVSTFLFTTPIHANSTNIGSNTATFLGDITGPILPAIALVILVWLVIKRDWIKTISTLALFLVIAYFTDWQQVKNLSGSIFGAIFK